MPVQIPVIKSQLIKSRFPKSRFPKSPRRTGPWDWDLAGVLTFIGVCAALLGDPEHVLPLLETRRPE